MPANDYLKVAAAHLRRAASFLQQQASDLMSERDRSAMQKTGEISKHEIDLKTKQAFISIQSDDRVKAAIAKEAQDLQRTIDNKKGEIKQVAQQLADVARSKQQASQDLANKARDLENRASSPEMN